MLGARTRVRTTGMLASRRSCSTAAACAGLGMRRTADLCAGMLLDSLSRPRRIMPAATVALVAGSMRMKLPVARLSV